jgi:class 3 adenylate cyclase
VVNLASRLQVSADPDGVLLDLATCALVEPDVALEPLRELDLPGLGRVAARRLAAGPAAEGDLRGNPCG